MRTTMRTILTLGVLATGLLALLAGCGSKSRKQTLQVKGSDTLIHLASTWAEDFMKENADIEVVVTGGGSGTGISALLNGTCDVANASREIKDKEMALAKEKGLDVKEFPVAQDGITVIVHPSNTVSTLTVEQLRKIFSGQVENWNQVGGPDETIVLFSRDHSSGTHAFFKERVLDKFEFAQSANFVPSNSAILTGVTQDEGAVGYVGLGYYLAEKDKVKAVAVKDGEAAPVLPSMGTVMDRSYPISRALHVYTAGEPQGAVKKYVDFILGPKGQELVEKNGFVAVKAK